jgi:hypothetical protein
MKKTVVVAWLALLFSGIAFLFWHMEFVYGLPTPVPKNYRLVKTGNTIIIPAILKPGDNEPNFIHFFNPDCPCSKFNMGHFKALVKEYGNEVHFSIVVLSPKHFSAQDIRERFGLDIPIYFDSSIAAACGVYSTPQAVIIDTQDHLFYRGNYNKARYCVDTRSNYAQQALDGLLQHRTLIFNQYATKAYGCTLPNCKK